VQKGSWSADVYINNAFDKRAAQYKYTECGVDVCGAHGVVAQYPNGQVYTGYSLPRTIGIRFKQDF
jgi:outer membrane receptor protein involved in Fe transport